MLLLVALFANPSIPIYQSVEIRSLRLYTELRWCEAWDKLWWKEYRVGLDVLGSPSDLRDRCHLLLGYFGEIISKMRYLQLHSTLLAQVTRWYARIF